jgi:hypothetical protein
VHRKVRKLNYFAQKSAQTSSRHGETIFGDTNLLGWLAFFNGNKIFIDTGFIWHILACPARGWLSPRKHGNLQSKPNVQNRL